MIKLQMKSFADFDAAKLERRIRASCAPPMRKAAYQLMKKQKKRLAKRSVTKKGNWPKPAPAGQSPHTIRVPNKTQYRLALIGYEQVDSGTYMVGVRALTPKKSTQNVPLTHEKGGTLMRVSTRWESKGGKAKSEAQRKAFRAKLKNADQNLEWTLRNNFSTKAQRAKYPARPFLVPAMVELQQDIPALFKGFFK